MARGPFPQLDLRATTSPDLVDSTAPAPNALASLAGEADQLGGTLRELQAKAAEHEGQGQAAADVAAGQVIPRNDGTVRGEAYDAVAKNWLGANRQAQMHVDLQGAYEANQDNPVELGKALDAIHAGYRSKPTGYADEDAALDGHFLLQRSDFMARAIAGARARDVDRDKASFLTDVDQQQQLLDQVAAGAPSDAAGGARITAAGQLYVKTLSKYGPKEAFDVGGVHFDADPNRRGAIGADDIARQAVAAVRQARITWITQTAQGLSDEGSRRMYARMVDEKWKAGDPAFAGLDGKDMDQLRAHLEASADRARADDRASKAEASKEASDTLEAFRYGKSVDFDAALSAAKRSGDAGLVAQVEFYRNADPAMRGVLQSVVARQLGLIGQPTGPAMVPVDDQGRPVAPDAQALTGEISANPQAYFSRALGGKPVTITSAARTPAHNAAVGGSPTSEHIPGNGAAWDIVVPGQSSAETFAQLRAAGIPHDQIIDEHTHVHFGLGPQMRGQALVKGGSWATPSDVKPGTPTYFAWASTREGFSTDPLAYVQGGANRPAIANVPILVPDGAFQPGAPAQAWSQAFRQRWALGQGLARTYGVPARLLTNGERDSYKASIDADPMKGVALAGMATKAVGPDAALRLMRELGETDFEASASLHIADLAAGGAVDFARTAAQGLQLQSAGKAHLEDTDRRDLVSSFDKQRGSAPPPVLTAAYATAQAAMVADRLKGVNKTADYYLNSALGMGAANGRLYGGPATVNGGKTVLPRWMSPAHVEESLQALGDRWAAQRSGPTWSNGQAVSGRELRDMRLVLQSSGSYRFVNPKTGNPLMGAAGRPFEIDLDSARGFIAQTVGPEAVRPGG